MGLVEHVRMFEKVQRMRKLNSIFFGCLVVGVFGFLALLRRSGAVGDVEAYHFLICLLLIVVSGVGFYCTRNRGN